VPGGIERNDGKVRHARCQIRWPDGKAILVRLAGIEPTTLGFGGQYSIH
jgi:hypothetical protein